MPRRYTNEERKFFESYVMGHSYKEIHTEFNKRFSNITQKQVETYISNNKLNTGRTGRFKKGHIPTNKGTKGGGWEPTQFKKGNVPANHKPVGTESERISKGGKIEIYIKIKEPNVWKMKHLYEWEKRNGKVPKDKVIIFLDGNTRNTDISNLHMIDKKVHIKMNQLGLRHNDRDLTLTGINVAELVVKTSERKRG